MGSGHLDDVDDTSRDRRSTREQLRLSDRDEGVVRPVHEQRGGASAWTWSIGDTASERSGASASVACITTRSTERR
jgi:hypothetical protein